MSDRRAEAFAALDERLHDELLFGDVRVIAYLAALRSVLERHEDDCTSARVCGWCLMATPCPDERVVIDALLGSEPAS